MKRWKCLFTCMRAHAPNTHTHIYFSVGCFVYLLLMVVSIIMHEVFLSFAFAVCILSNSVLFWFFQHALDLQLSVANILQSLVHTERNQQVMCEAGLHARLLQRCSAALSDEDHSLHPPLQRMFERLASQALQPMVLRSEEWR